MDELPGEIEMTDVTSFGDLRHCPALVGYGEDERAEKQ